MATTESLIRQCADVEQCVMITQKDDVFAFVTPVALDPDSILNKLAETIDAYLLPTAICPVAIIPRTRQGATRVFI